SSFAPDVDDGRAPPTLLFRVLRTAVSVTARSAARFADVQPKMPRTSTFRAALRPAPLSGGRPVKEPAMSMIRDLRAAVRPSRRRDETPYRYESAAPACPNSAVVDCGVYREGRRVSEP